MRARPPQIVAFGGGGCSMEWGNPLLDDHVLALAGMERPKVCFLPTASGDADHYVVRFYRAFPASCCEPSHISLFRRPASAIRGPTCSSRTSSTSAAAACLAAGDVEGPRT